MAGTQSIVAGVAGRYATALFEMAHDEDKLDLVDQQLNGFAALLKDNEDLDQVIKSPAFSLGEKGRVVGKILEKSEVVGLTANFLALIAQNNRLYALRDIVSAFNALQALHRGEVRAQVISVRELSEPHKAALTEKLKSTIGQDVKIETKTEPDLLGGLIVKVGSKMIDTSLRTKLNNLHVSMKEVS